MCWNCQAGLAPLHRAIALRSCRARGWLSLLLQPACTDLLSAPFHIWFHIYWDFLNCLVPVPPLSLLSRCLKALQTSPAHWMWWMSANRSGHSTHTISRCTFCHPGGFPGCVSQPELWQHRLEAPVPALSPITEGCTDFLLLFGFFFFFQTLKIPQENKCQKIKGLLTKQ